MIPMMGRTRLGWLPAARPLPWAVVAGYFVAFVVIDWASFIRPLRDLNITPWNPQPGLAVALLLADRRLWWVVWSSLMAAEVLIRGVPGDLFVVTTATAALTCSYLAISTALQMQMSDGGRLRGVRDVGWLLTAIAAGALLSGAVYVGTFAVAGVMPGRPLWEALGRYWVGDAVGMVIALPAALVALDPAHRRSLLNLLRHREAGLLLAMVACLLWLLFREVRAADIDGSYLLLLPVVWGAVRFGTVGALLPSAAIQVGLIVAVQAAQRQDAQVFALQLLMAAIAMTGLVLGVVVDEQRRAETRLRRSLRLAAAGHLSAALAHELSQPLTALVTYGQACEQLARDATLGTPGARVALADVTRRMADDARRAGDVVRRLRDFFRGGALHLERTSMTTLLDEALARHGGAARAAEVTVRLDAEPGLPEIDVDRVQMQLVLRNLLANAVEACEADGLVTVSCRHSHTGVLTVVSDSGPGLSEEAVDLVFDAGISGKPDGMGMGLGICRAIVEGHGGRLWAEPGAGGRFYVDLPAADGDDDVD